MEKIECINCKNAVIENGLIYCKIYKLYMITEFTTKECYAYENSEIKLNEGLFSE